TPDDLYAKSAILIDMQTGRVLLSKDTDAKRYPASTTKIMTLLLALENMNLNQTVTIPGAASAVPKDSSLVPVYPGEVMPLRDLLCGLMLRSGNDAANAVAVLTSGSLESFVTLMNKKAAELGMTGTVFTNPHGYHDKEHYTTAGDLAKLSLYALQNPAFRDIITATSYTMQATSRRPELLIKVNTDLFNPLSRFYYAPAFGIKSGFTRAAGFCYVGSAAKDGRLLLAIVLGGRTRYQAWTDITRLFQAGFNLE
ncbi:MAG: D-alanyl-D-alanine carboxypeptidase, partial [Clostridiales bacterium]|nr:D-alanyl-D-alanine carboxypeptidase [Clostridiales bacterium]